MIKNFWKKLTDPLLSIIERYSGKLNHWAYQKIRTTDAEEWIEGYKEWKKLKEMGVVSDKVKLKDLEKINRCPHN